MIHDELGQAAVAFRGTRALTRPFFSPRGRRYVRYVVSVALLVLLWNAAASFFNPNFFPSPALVLRTAVKSVEDGTLWTSGSASLARILTGFLIGSAVGAPIGLAIGAFRPVRDWIEPYVQFFRFIPSIAWLTPAVIWFGIGETSKIFIIVYTTVFIVIINTAVGVSSIPINKIRAGQSLGARPIQIFLHVTLPATVPFVLAGMRLAMANSFTTVVSAEMIAAREGLGFLIWNARTFFQTDVIFMSIVLLGVLGFATDRVFRLLIDRFAGHYGPTS